MADRVRVVDVGTSDQPASSGAKSESGEPTADELVPEPDPRLIRTPADAEDVAAEWMRYYGFVDAVTTAPGADGGIDVTSDQAIAQVKAHMSPIGRPDLQKLHGVAAAERKLALFFSLMDYTPPAREWADAVGMALFRFDLSGRPEAVNGPAAVLAGDGGSSPQRGLASRDDPRPIWEFPETCDDERAIRVLTREARPVLGRQEMVTWIRKCWLELFQLEVEFTRREGRRRVLAQGSSAPVFESVSGRAFGLRSQGRVPTPAEATRRLIRPRVSADSVVESVLSAGLSHARRPVMSQEMFPPRLAQAGVPSDVERLTSVGGGHRLALPLFVALFQTGSSRRLVCVDGVDGSRRPELDTVFTENLTSIVFELEAR
ncbi:MAG TPA: restriction endonuclease [Acidimicrobiia bacterium]|jgi:hypothetical protein